MDTFCRYGCAPIERHRSVLCMRLDGNLAIENAVLQGQQVLMRTRKDSGSKPTGLTAPAPALFLLARTACQMPVWYARATCDASTPENGIADRTCVCLQHDCRLWIYLQRYWPIGPNPGRELPMGVRTLTQA